MRTVKGVTEIESLRSEIRSGRLAPGSMVGTESAFSQKWGIARNTVRRGIDTLVQEGLLERRPGKGLFVRLPSTVTRVVQLVVPDISWEHSQQIVRGAQLAGAQAGIQIQVYDAHGRMELDLEVVRRLPDRLMDGAIIISLHHRRFSEVLFELKSAGFPFILVDQRLQDLDVSTVEIENYRGGYMVGQKLAELGHHRAALVGPLSLPVITDRLSGFRDAMLDAKILFDRSLVIDLGGDGLADFLSERVNKTAEKLVPLLERADRPSAIFDASGDVAPEVYRAAKQVGLRIPEDLSVITFEDSPYFRMLDPEVARLKHPWIEVGKMALEMLVRQMDQKKSTAERQYEHRVVPAELIPGMSLGPVKRPT
jgi:LacI family transcriptional regulator